MLTTLCLLNALKGGSMKYFLKLLSLNLITVSAFAQPAPQPGPQMPQPTTIGRWFRGGLYVAKVKSVVPVNVLRVSDADQMPAYKGWISQAELRIVTDVLPYGCNVSFLKGEIAGQVVKMDLWNDKPEVEVVIGDMTKYAMSAEICPGVPSRQVTLVLPLVNSISSKSAQNVVYTYTLPTVMVNAKMKLHIKVLVNQKNNVIRVLGVTQSPVMTNRPAVK